MKLDGTWFKTDIYSKARSISNKYQLKKRVRGHPNFDSKYRIVFFFFFLLVQNVATAVILL